MSTRNDFRVEQTYDEIREYVFNAAYDVLTWHTAYEPPPTDSECEWAEATANRIADHSVLHLDTAEEGDS